MKWYERFDLAFALKSIMDVSPCVKNSDSEQPACQDTTKETEPRPKCAPRGKKDRSGENLAKRWRTLVRTARQLRRDYEAEVYISISVRRKRKMYMFRSSKDTFALSADDLV